MNNARRFVNNEKGVALPIAMLALIILSALVIGFSVLASTEPTIANNQLMVAQARSIAEGGIERAIWALNFGLTHPTDPNGIPPSLAGTASAPYDSSQLTLVSTGGTTIGGYRVTVTKPPSASLERTITAVGWVPDDDTTTNRKAHQKITVTVVGPPALPDPPAALSVRGELQVGGTSLIDSRSDTSCGPKLGTLTTGTTCIGGAQCRGGAPAVWGATDSIAPATPNDVTDAGGGSIPANAQDAVENASTSVFDLYALTDTDINGLRAYAKAHGTYLQGAVEFSAGHMLIPNGLVFIDTDTGTNITPATDPSHFADVTIHGNPTVDPSGIFSGWLFVNGSLRIDGEFTAHGLVYAQNDIIYRGTGSAAISGAVMSRNIQDTNSTVDSDTSGNARVIYNCAWAKNGGGMFQTWSIQPGTYKELCDSCT